MRSCSISRLVSWAEKGEYDKAITDYTETIRLNPNDAHAYNNRGQAWGTKGEFDKSIGDFSEAIRLNPKDAEAYYNRGVSWVSKGELDKSIGDFTETIRLDPKNAKAYNNRGNSWKSKREYAKAIEDLTESIQLNPLRYAAYSHLAWLQTTCPDSKYRDGTKAVANARKACELTDWKDDSLVQILACAYAVSGDFDAATNWLEKAIEMNPKVFKERRQKMLQLFRQRKRYRGM